jgi:predicted amidophosphoribosyltransferase
MLSPAGAARAAIRQIFDFALPPRCPGCGEVTEDEHRFWLACWQKLQFLGEPCCARCGLPFDYDRGAGVECGACLASPPAFDSLRAAVAYGEIARNVALKLKYAGRPGVALTLAHFMRRHLDPSTDAILAPVPLHRWRIWKRGYNQSALIVSALGRETGLETRLDLLTRAKATPSLRGLNRSQRARRARRISGRRQDEAGPARPQNRAGRPRLYDRCHRQWLRPGTEARRGQGGEHSVLGASCRRQ